MLYLSVILVFLVMAHTGSKAGYNSKPKSFKTIHDLIIDENAKEQISPISVAGITGSVTLKMTYQQWAALSPGEQQKLIEKEEKKLNQPVGVGPKIPLSDKAQEEYKRNMRYQIWANKWKDFNYENEGIYIGENLLKVIRDNASNFMEFHMFM